MTKPIDLWSRRSLITATIYVYENQRLTSYIHSPLGSHKIFYFKEAGSRFSHLHITQKASFSSVLVDGLAKVFSVSHQSDACDQYRFNFARQT